MHYTVLVIGEDIDKILYPYWELDLSREDMKKDPRAKFKVEIPDGISASGLSHADQEFLSWKIKNPDLCTKYNYKTSAEWIKKYFEYAHVPGEGYGYYHNPNAKWDWYSPGGRWTGVFPLKKGATGKLGQPGAFGNQPKEGRVDQARIGDIDWTTAHKEAQEQSGREWDELFGIVEPDFCLYNDRYVEKQRALHLKLYGTREEYIRQRGYWTPYAYVSEKGGWVAPGEMHYFSSSDETEDRDRYEKQYIKMITSLPKDTLITLVDCHI
jgi:hypothetical protein